jgi:hypothetical protein
MATKKYYLNKEKTDVLRLKWGYNWKNFAVIHNQEEIGSFANKKELLAGKSFMTADGREIFIRLKGGITNELEILVNGEVLPGSPSDPKTIVKTAFGIALFVGLLNVVLGAIGTFAEVELLQNLGANEFMLVFGVVITALAFGIKAKSFISLILVNVIYGLDSILWIIMLFEATDNIPIAGLIFRVLIIMALIRAIPAMKKLKKQS